MIRVSLTNYLSTATITAVSAASGYPASNLALATRPFQPYISGAAGAGQIATADLGSAKSVEAIALGRLSFTALTVQADDSASFNSSGGSPQFSQALTASEALNGRYHTSYRPPSAVVRRHWRVVIADQSPIATLPHSAGAGYYVGGWWWLGPLSTVRDILMDPELERLHPVDRLPLPSGGASESDMGYPYVTITARRVAEQDAGGLDTQMRQWLTLDRAWREAGAALVLPRDDVPSDAYVMRQLAGSKFTWGRVFSDGDLALEEVTQ